MIIEKKLMDIINEFKAESSSLAKAELLAKYKDDDDFSKYLTCVLDSLNVYGLQDKKISKHLGKTSGNRGSKNLFDVFEYLSKHNTGTDKDAAIVAQFIDSFDEAEVKTFLLESFTKKIKFGVTATSVNKVFGKGYISDFKVQLAQPYDKVADKIEGKEFAITEKFDGLRIFAVVDSSEVKLFTRDGKLKTGFIEIESELSQLPSGCYDGEMIAANHESLQDRDVLQQTLSVSQSKGEKTGLVFILFDYVTLKEFREGKSMNNYNNRQAILKERIGGDLKFIQLAKKLYQGEDIGEISKWINHMDANGREGIMLNVVSAPYEFKRTANLIKVKTMLSFDEVCTGVFEGEGKYKGKLGGIELLYKGQYPLRCGSGFSDEQRQLYWDQPELIVGKVVEIQYFRESSNADGGLSVSFPVFKVVREDKSEASYY